MLPLVSPPIAFACGQGSVNAGSSVRPQLHHCASTGRPRGHTKKAEMSLVLSPLGPRYACRFASRMCVRTVAVGRRTSRVASKCERKVRPSLCSNLLLHHVCCRFCWREEFGAPEEVCLTSAVVLCLLPWQLSEACRCQSPSHPDLSLPLSCCFCFSWSSMAPFKSCSTLPFSVRVSLSLISSVMLPNPSSCCLLPGATRRIKKCHLAPRPLSWSCCVGSRCLHRSVEGLQSNCCVPAFQPSRDPSNCLLLRERIDLRGQEEQVLVARDCLGWESC